MGWESWDRINGNRVLMRMNSIVDVWVGRLVGLRINFRVAWWVFVRSVFVWLCSHFRLLAIILIGESGGPWWFHALFCGGSGAF